MEDDWRHPPMDAVCDTCGRKEWWNGRCKLCAERYEGQNRGWPIRQNEEKDYSYLYRLPSAAVMQRLADARRQLADELKEREREDKEQKRVSMLAAGQNAEQTISEP